MRAQEELLKNDFPDRHRMLTAMDFLWLPPVLADDIDDSNEKIAEVPPPPPPPPPPSRHALTSPAQSNPPNSAR